MAKNVFLNIGKTFFKEISAKFLEQGKEIVISSGTDILEKGKIALTEKVNEKFFNLSQEMEEKKTEKKISSSFSANSSEEIDVQNNEKELEILPTSKNGHDSEMVLKDEIYRNADAFEENLHRGLNGMVRGLAAGNPAEAAEVLKSLVNMASEVSKFTEVQKTRRKEIEAERDVYVEKIRAQKEVLIVYLEKSFDERKNNFEKLFEIVDHAIASNNMQQLAMGLQSINTLAATSPFKSLATIESTQQALTDNSHIWDF